MMKAWRTPPVTGDLEVVVACPFPESYYSCDDFKGCCAADPCDFLDYNSPCLAAKGSANGGEDIHGDEGPDTSTATVSATSTRVITTHKSTTFTTRTITKSVTTSSSSSDSSLESSSSTSSDSSVISTFTTADNTIETSTSTVGATDSITTTSTPAPTASPSATPINGAQNTGSLRPNAITGIAAGSAVGGLALLALLFWLVRRRRLSKRMSSLRGGSPDGNGTMSKRNRSPSLTGTALGRDAFADSGAGQAHSNHEAWPLAHCAASSYQNHDQSSNPMYNPHAQPMYANNNTGATPSPVSPQPRQHQHDYAELDSPMPQLVGQGHGPTRPGPRPVVTTPTNSMMMPQSQSQSSMSTRSTALDARIHPPTLTPGHLGTQMSIQGRGDTDISNNIDTNMSDTNMSVGVSDYQEQEHDQRNQNHNQNQHEHHEDDNESEAPRATLNATDHERQNNLYPNSWAQI